MGTNDLMAGFPVSARCQTFDSDGEGTIAARPDAPDLNLPPASCAGTNVLRDVAFGLIDADAEPDRVVAYSGATSSFTGVSTTIAGGELLVPNGSNSIFSVFLSRSAVAADLDGDADLDVVAADLDSNTVAWFRNDGSGVFDDDTPPIASFLRSESIRVADLDGDLDLDIVAANIGSFTIEWFENDGTGTFSSGGPSIATGLASLVVRAADLDGDGDQDVLSGSIQGGLRWFRNDGSGGFTPVATPIASFGAYRPESVAVADLDGNGSLDVVLAAQLNQTIEVLLNDGAGNFTLSPSPVVTGYESESVAAADLDDDGDLDILAADSLGATIDWFVNDGSGLFTPAALPIATGIASRSVEPADLDGDGLLDVLVGQIFVERTGSGPAPTQPPLSWYRNAGSGAFVAATPAIANASPSDAVSAADFDGDGDLDVLVPSLRGGQERIFWYENGLVGAGPTVFSEIEWQANEGRADASEVFFPRVTDFRVAVASVAGTLAELALVDLDRDANTDVVSITVEGDLAWHRNIANGSSFDSNPIAALAGAEGVAVAATDLDGDGDADLVVATRLPDQVVAFENRLNEVTADFGSAVVLRVLSSSPRSLHSGDFDADGDSDLVVERVGSGAALAEGDLERLTNDGTPLDGVAWAAGVVGSGFKPIVFDLDFDGIDDLVSVLGNAVQFWPGASGSTVFGARVLVSVEVPLLSGAFAEAVLADLDGNRLPDFAFAVNGAGAAGSEEGQVFWIPSLRPFSDPLRADSDGDGMDDRFELNASLDLWSADANPPNGRIDGADDLDGDGLSNLSESLAGGLVDQADRDADGLTDAEEWRAGEFLEPVELVVDIRRVAFGDVGGDGLPDMVYLASRPGPAYELVWADNQTLTETMISTDVVFSNDFARRPIRPALGDYDGDGDLDVAWMDYVSASNVEVYFQANDGSGAFSPKQSLAVIEVNTGLEAWLAAADLDRDGQDELVVSGQLVGLPFYQTRVFRGRASPSGTVFELQAELEPGPGVTSPEAVLADMTGDGYLDLSGRKANGPTCIVLWDQDPFSIQLGFTFEGPSPPESCGWSSAGLVTVGDIDSDGDLDWIADETSGLLWLENLGDGLTSPGPRTTIDANSSRAARAADLDADGRLDVVSARDDGIHLIRGSDGLGAFSPPELLSPAVCDELDLVDYDQDGRLDIVCDQPAPGPLLLLRQASRRSFSFLPDSDGDGLCDGMLAGMLSSGFFCSGAEGLLGTDPLDVDSDDDGIWENVEPGYGYDPANPDTDGDGLCDGFVAVPGVCVFGEDVTSDGILQSFETSPLLPDTDGDGVCDGPVSFPGLCVSGDDLDSDGDGMSNRFEGDNGFDPDEPDQNGNGIPDGLDDTDLDGLLNAAEERVGTNPNDEDSDDDGLLDRQELGTPVFEAERVITTAADGIRRVFAADVDGDGDADVISASIADGEIAWHENADGQGSFGAEQVIATLTGATGVVAGDVDGDGDEDVLAIAGSGNLFAWYENTDGAGTFELGQQILVLYPVALQVADLDGDGDADVALARGNGLSSYRVSWLENLDGAGGFATEQIISSEVDGTNAIFTADIDLDGDVDVLSTAAFSNQVVWFENLDGAGSFGTKQIITTAGEFPAFIAASDLDFDGDADVVVSSLLDSEIAWYENLDGLGTFGGQNLIESAAPSPLIALPVDLDGDGDVDVLVATRNDDTVAWYENTDGVGGFSSRQILPSASDRPVWLAATDLDGDGDRDVIVASETERKIAWFEQRGGTDPTRADTDGDGLCDGGLASGETATAAACPFGGEDLDGNGSYDVGTETDPDDADTDGDGVDDLTEIWAGTDPLDPADFTLPIALPDSVTIAANSPATTIDVRQNDVDPDGTPGFTIESVTQPASGTVAISGNALTLEYTPDPDTCNDGSPTDDFSYSLSPGGSSTTVSVTVSCPPPPAYSSGFESGVYLPGPLDGQGGWTTFGSGSTSVASLMSSTGLQGLEIVRASGQAEPDGAALPIDFDLSGRGELSIMLSAYLASSASPSRWTIASLVFGDGSDPFADGLVEVVVLQTGEILVNDGLVHLTGYFVPRDRWNRFEVVIFPSSRSVAVYFNGTQVHVGGPYAGTSPNLHSLELYGEQVADDFAYLDDVEILVDAPVMFSSGFEPPSYSQGALAGQDGWGTFGTGGQSVQTTVTGTGVQAFQISRGSGTGVADGGSRNVSVSAADLRLVVGASVYLESATLASYWTVLRTVFASGAVDLNVSEAGEIQVFDGDVHSTGVFVTRDRWNRFQQVIQSAGATTYLEVLYNGAVVHSGIAPAVDGSQLVAVSAYGQQVAEDAAYVDDLSAVVPEPGMGAMLVVGAATLAWLSRRRRLEGQRRTRRVATQAFESPAVRPGKTSRVLRTADARHSDKSAP